MAFETDVLPSLSADIQTAYRLWARAKKGINEEALKANQKKNKDLTVQQVSRMIESLNLGLDRMRSRWGTLEDLMVTKNIDIETLDDENSSAKLQAEDIVDFCRKRQSLLERMTHRELMSSMLRQL